MSREPDVVNADLVGPEVSAFASRRRRPVVPRRGGDVRGPLVADAASRDVVDESGLRAAFLAHGAELTGFARRSLNSPERAEDVVQETFARAWRSRSRFDASLGSLRTWLYAIERRVILDVSARESRALTVTLEPCDEPEGVDDVERAMRGWMVESAISRLDADHRFVITELYFHGRSGREVAELLSLPEGTVRSRAFYALRMLRILLEEAGWDQ